MTLIRMTRQVHWVPDCLHCLTGVFSRPAQVYFGPYRMSIINIKYDSIFFYHLGFVKVERKVGSSNPSRDRPKLLKQVVISPLPNSQQQMWVSRDLGDDHYNPRWLMTMSAEHRSKFAVLHRQWWSLQICEIFASGTKKTTTNKYTNQ